MCARAKRACTGTTVAKGEETVHTHRQRDTQHASAHAGPQGQPSHTSCAQLTRVPGRCAAAHGAPCRDAAGRRAACGHVRAITHGGHKSAPRRPGAEPLLSLSSVSLVRLASQARCSLLAASRATPSQRPTREDEVPEITHKLIASPDTNTELKLVHSNGSAAQDNHPLGGGHVYVGVGGRRGRGV